MIARAELESDQITFHKPITQTLHAKPTTMTHATQPSLTLPFLLIDKENKAYINKSGGVAIVSQCLNSCHPETVAAALTTLMFLVTPQSKPGECGITCIECIVGKWESIRTDMK